MLCYDWNLDTSAPEPPDKNPNLNNGDIVSRDQEFKEALDHVAFVVGQYQYDRYKSPLGCSGYYFGDVADAHTIDTWHMIWHGKWKFYYIDRYIRAQVYAWGLNSSAH